MLEEGPTEASGYLITYVATVSNRLAISIQHSVNLMTVSICLMILHVSQLFLAIVQVSLIFFWLLILCVELLVHLVSNETAQRRWHGGHGRYAHDDGVSSLTGLLVNDDACSGAIFVLTKLVSHFERGI